ncbi:tRNA (adenine(58)-N(1))-methyltransferase, mitochondrial isoform X1 [Paramormyrops kingsleyae]|uniref:tRNA (adenine(58)-N(1))-methyltransferase n=1 Tax=Paramormyrops kingsleyae TaxID=1676925 RepID=A0A3B3QMN6_9TELE|nr:tRNA (adenine(58)-N(1))-methyltransferase, mitochondrial isoform X1 [Paramormyrops kingsleyae]
MWTGVYMYKPYRMLVRICVTFSRQQWCREPPRWRGVCQQMRFARNFGTGDKEHNENEGERDNPESQLSGEKPSSQGLVFGKLGSRRRHLSPLERISQLLPQESLSQEVWELRRGRAEDQRPLGSMESSQEMTDTAGMGPEGSHENGRQRPDLQPCQESAEEVNFCDREEKMEEWQVGDGGDSSPAIFGEPPLGLGELVLAEYRGKGWLEFRKMFQLQEKGHLQSTWGSVAHSTIVGSRSGSLLQLSSGSPILVRRPSLEEYVLLMKRAPAIAYPKDSTAMLMMMDVSEGDSVLESGSGSGAMTLFLSRAVGSRGCVTSVERREDHHQRALRNYQRWRKAWKLRRGEEWPDNVRFHVAELQGAGALLSGLRFNSAVLDMLSPQVALPAVFPYLNDGAVCAVYLVNLTQVIDLLEGVRVSGLPLQCERIIEVQHRDWLVAPAVMKDGTAAARVAPFSGTGDEEEEQSHAEGKEEEDFSCDDDVPFGTVTYMVRPHHQQTAHTAFLVKLRKIKAKNS